MSIFQPYLLNTPKIHPNLSKLYQSILIMMALCGTAYASEYTSVTFFGDSLTDGGYFEPTLNTINSGQFTTNPDDTWATPFAEHLGLASVANTVDGVGSANNYAIGDARAGIDVDRQGIMVASAKTQLDNYLANNKVDQKGLYSVWIGSNDLLAVVKDLGNANSIITDAAQDHVAVINKLHQNGAKTILMPNIPDVGLTPNSIANGPFVQNLSTNFATQYNNALYEGVLATGANIIPLDTFTLLQKVAQSPSIYGFSNMTDKACGNVDSLECGPSDLVEENANNSYFFADGIHPTGRAHKMIADYANSVVTAPSQVSVLPHIATQSALATNDNLQTHINQSHNSVTAQPAKLNIWMSADINSLDVAEFESSNNLQMLLGADINHGSADDALSGIYTNFSQSELESNARTGIDDVDYDEWGVGLYHSQYLNDFKINGAVGYSNIDMQITRNVSLDNVTQTYQSDIEGERYFASLNAGYPFKLSDTDKFASTSLTPYMGATINRVKLDAIKENDLGDPLAMQFSKQKYDTTYGKIGLKASSRFNDLELYGDLHYQKQLDDDHKSVSANINTLPDIVFTTPKAKLDDDNFGVTLGVARQFGAMKANAGVSFMSGDDDESTSVFIGLNRAF